MARKIVPAQPAATVADIIGNAKASIVGMRQRITVCYAALDPAAAAYVAGTNEEVRTILDEDIGERLEEFRMSLEEIEAGLAATGENVAPSAKVSNSKEAINVTEIPYFDNERDYRDCTVIEALDAALQLIEDDDDDHTHRDLDGAVIRLARDRLSAKPEVAHG